MKASNSSHRIYLVEKMTFVECAGSTALFLEHGRPRIEQNVADVG